MLHEFEVGGRDAAGEERVEEGGRGQLGVTGVGGGGVGRRGGLFGGTAAREVEREW